MNPLRVAIVGFGKIARDQHVPAIAATEGVELVAVADPNASLPGVPHAATLDQLLRDGPEIDAVSICTPPQARQRQAAIALAAGKHVLLEKPPGATVAEVMPLQAAAQKSRRTLFTAWHSRFAPAVEPARQLLADRKIASVRITWKEDVRVWHPGQAWIFEAGGLGVFDPGINALSILTRILPGSLVVQTAELYFPSNCECPIAATLELRDMRGAPIHMELDFRQTGTESWDIHVETDDGDLQLSKGASVLHIDRQAVSVAQATEYSRLYAHFAALIRAKTSDTDVSPLMLVADAFLTGRRIEVDAFHE